MGNHRVLRGRSAFGGGLFRIAWGGFVNVPMSDLDGEYLVVRPQALIGVRVEPQFSAVDDA